jgi:ethanolamine utilization microcompartment shell protein EutL
VGEEEANRPNALVYAKIAMQRSGYEVAIDHLKNTCGFKRTYERESTYFYTAKVQRAGKARALRK